MGSIPICSGIAVLNWYRPGIYLYVCHTGNRIPIIPWNNQLASVTFGAVTATLQTLHESFALRVAYEWKGTKWKMPTDTVTYFIVKGSLSIYMYGWENVIFIIKSSYELRSMLLRGAHKVSSSNSRYVVILQYFFKKYVVLYSSIPPTPSLKVYTYITSTYVQGEGYIHHT